MSKQSIPFAISIAFLLLASCQPKAGEIVKRDGHPDFVRIANADPTMIAAIQKAQSTLAEFKKSLTQHSSKYYNFAVKVEFYLGSNKSEHIWLSDPKFEHGQISGRIGNEPVDAKFLQFGQLVTAPESNISDWMYVDSGVLRGGFTIRVLLDKMSAPERDRQLQSWNFRID